MKDIDKQIAELEAKLKALKSEKKNKVAEYADIKYSKEFHSWVKILPCGLQDWVYYIAFTYKYDSNDTFSRSDSFYALYRDGKKDKFVDNSSEINFDDVWISKSPLLRPSRYALLGKTIFLSKEECLKWLKTTSYYKRWKAKNPDREWDDTVRDNNGKPFKGE